MATIPALAAELDKAVQFARTDLPGVDMSSQGYQMLNQLAELTSTAGVFCKTWDDLLEGLRTVNQRFGLD